ncbi:MAG: hypothetical protein JNM98_03660 [Rhodocyclaceae bacterium]|nr:hypothetical protein [Rhodocyclaceae bacterium]
MNDANPHEPAAEVAASHTTTLHPTIWALIVAVALFASTLALAIGWYFIPRQRFATVDLDEVFQVQQLRMTQIISVPGAGDPERARAAQLALEFGPKTEAALRAVALECQCLVLVRGAVAHGPLADYTPSLKQALGQDGLDAKKMRQDMMAALAARASPGPGTTAAGADLPLNFLNRGDPGK